MPAMLLWIIKNPVLSAAIVAICLLGAFSGYELTARLHDASALKASEIANVQLLDQKAALEASAKTLTLQVALAKKAQDELAQTLTTLADKQAHDATILEDIDHAPASSDAPVAPVLRRALGGLR